MASIIKQRIASFRNGSSVPEGQKLALKMERRKKIVAKGLLAMPYIRILLLAVGYGALLLLPSDALSRGTYISENAIQPGQVNTYWNWGDVGTADIYADKVDVWRNLTSQERARAIAQEFADLGLSSSTQDYAFRTSSSPTSSILSNGTNAYAILQAPRTDGSEALVLAASWNTRAKGSDVRGGDVNVRGVASVLGLAEYLRKLSLWSKDIIFLIADDYTEGTHAWLQAYHREPQSNAYIQSLDLTTGPIWAAINLDFLTIPSATSEFTTGTNGQLPNLDLINSAIHIARYTGNIPVLIHTTQEDYRASYTSPDSLLHPVIDHIKTKEYGRAATNMLLQIGHGALGTPSGPEGVYGRFRIDAITFFAVPAEGPHGFHAIGKTVESLLRSLNNLLERLHQSFFLYLMQSTGRFVSVGNYLIGPVAVSVAITLTGLELWSRTFNDDDEMKVVGKEGVAMSAVVVLGRRGPAMTQAFRVILVSFGVGILACLPWPSPMALFIYLIPPLIFLFRLPTLPPTSQSLNQVLRPFVLLQAGCILAVTSTLNFSLGASFAALYGIPFCYFKSTKNVPRRIAQIVLIVGLHPATMAGAWHMLGLAQGDSGAKELVERVWRDWAILGSWFVPFVMGVVSPLLLQLLVVVSREEL